MKQNDLIHRYTLGDKLNELSSFLVDNYRILFRWSLMFALPVAVLVTILDSMSTSHPTEEWVNTFFLCLMMNVLIASFLTVMKEYYFNGTELKDIKLRPLLPSLLKNVAYGSLTVLVFEAVYSVLFCWLFHDSMDGKFIAVLLKLFFYLFVTIELIMPLYFILNVTVFEEKFGVASIKRGLRLSFARPFITVLFVMVLCFIGYSVPTSLTAVLSFFFEVFGPSVFQSSIDTFIPAEYLTFITNCFMYFSLIIALLLIALASIIEYGNNVELSDNIEFMTKFKNFEKL